MALVLHVLRGCIMSWTTGVLLAVGCESWKWCVASCLAFVKYHVQHCSLVAFFALHVNRWSPPIFAAEKRVPAERSYGVVSGITHVPSRQGQMQIGDQVELPRDVGGGLCDVTPDVCRLHGTIVVNRKAEQCGRYCRGVLRAPLTLMWVLAACSTPTKIQIQVCAVSRVPSMAQRTCPAAHSLQFSMQWTLCVYIKFH